MALKTALNLCFFGLYSLILLNDHPFLESDAQVTFLSLWMTLMWPQRTSRGFCPASQDQHRSVSYLNYRSTLVFSLFFTCPPGSNSDSIVHINCFKILLGLLVDGSVLNESRDCHWSKEENHPLPSYDPLIQQGFKKKSRPPKSRNLKMTECMQCWWRAWQTNLAATLILCHGKLRVWKLS